MEKETIGELHTFLMQALGSTDKCNGVQALYQIMRHRDSQPYVSVDDFTNTFLESQQSDVLVLSDYSTAILARKQ